MDSHTCPQPYESKRNLEGLVRSPEGGVAFLSWCSLFAAFFRPRHFFAFEQTPSFEKLHPVGHSFPSGFLRSVAELQSFCFRASSDLGSVLVLPIFNN